MRPHQHPSNNTVLAPPSGSTDVVALPVTRVVYDGQYLATRSYWMPTAEELAALNAGEPVCFEIFQPTHAPILLGVEGLTMSTTYPLENHDA